MTPLRQKMLDELQRRNYSPSTTRNYILAVRQFASYFGKSPERLGPDELLRYQLYLLNERKLKPGTVEMRMSALRFLYKKVLKRRDINFDDMPLPKVPKKLPVVLSQQEVAQLIDAAPNIKYRRILMLLYATGLRRTEASLLKISDVDRERMVIHVRQGKGQRDRDLPISPKLLEALREYYRHKRPKNYLFPSGVGHRGPENPMSDKSVWHACNASVKRVGLKKKIGPHTFRHTFATHLLESGADLRTVQMLLGHSSLTDTAIYLHLSQRHLSSIPNPLDQITLRSDRHAQSLTEDKG